MENGPPGKSKGSCFPESFGGSCTGIPEQCVKGNHISTQCGSPCKNSHPDRNNKPHCVTTCKSNGTCKVKIENGPPGAKSGSCVPLAFGGNCNNIPPLCHRGNNIVQQCGTPCKEGTINV